MGQGLPAVSSFKNFCAIILWKLGRNVLCHTGNYIRTAASYTPGHIFTTYFINQNWSLTCFNFRLWYYHHCYSLMELWTKKCNLIAWKNCQSLDLAGCAVYTLSWGHRGELVSLTGLGPPHLLTEQHSWPCFGGTTIRWTENSGVACVRAYFCNPAALLPRTSCSSRSKSSACVCHQFQLILAHRSPREMTSTPSNAI